jgi:hypothetical protein
VLVGVVQERESRFVDERKRWKGEAVRAGRVVIKTNMSFRLGYGGWLVVERRVRGGRAQKGKPLRVLTKQTLEAPTSAEAPLRGSRCPICPSASAGTRRVATAAFNLQLCKVSWSRTGSGRLLVTDSIALPT